MDSVGQGRYEMNREQRQQLEKDLWASADNLRANSDLKSSEYSTPVLGVIFLKFADINYRRHEADIQAEFEKLKGGRREMPLHEIAIAKCGFYLPRLISGKIAFEDLDIQFPPSMREDL